MADDMSRHEARGTGREEEREETKAGQARVLG